jgi:hypothetical protein
MYKGKLLPVDTVLIIVTNILLIQILLPRLLPSSSA